MRTLRRTIVSLALVLVTSVSAWAYDFKVDDFAYNIISDTTVEVTNGGNYDNPNNPDIVIPAKVSYNGVDYYITQIGDNAFKGCEYYLKSVVIPEGVVSIGVRAFYDCKKMQNVTIPESVTEISGSAFAYCYALTFVYLPHGVTTLESYLFCGCYSLKTVIIPEGVTEIKIAVFDGCTSLRSVNIPSSVTNIGSSNNSPPFCDCYSLDTIIINSVYVADNFYTIFRSGNYYDGHDYHYQKDAIRPSFVSFPEGTSVICNNAFNGCEKMESFSIPSTVNSIGDYAFQSCSSLKSIILPESVRAIGDFAFKLCSSLQSIVIPDGVSSLGWGTFDFCNIESISLPYNIKNIHSGVMTFSNCALSSVIIRGRGLADFNVLSNLKLNSSTLFFVDSWLYDTYNNNSEWENRNRYIISADMLEPQVVELIADETESSLFAAIGNSSIYVGNLKIIGNINGFDIMALRNKFIHLLYLDLSEADIVANDGGYEYYTGCSLKSDNVLGNHSFADLSLQKVVLPESLKEIGDEAFSGCNHLEEVMLPEGLISIGSSAFRDCHLNDISLPNSLISIGDYAFSNSNLSCILRIPDQVETINLGSFSNTLIDSLILGNNVSEIKDGTWYNSGGAFSNCNNLKGIKFNCKLKVVGSYAFENCSNLKYVSLPYTVERIGEKAFTNCTSIELMKIPSMTKTIGEEAFAGCNNIRNVYTYTVEPTNINQKTFSCFTKAMLNVPKTSRKLYIYDTKWSQFLFVQEFEEPYDAFYLNGDYELNDKDGRLEGEPDADMYETSGLIVQGDEIQELKDVVLTHNGKDCASVIGASGDVTGNQVNLTAKSMKVNISVEGNRWYFFCFPFNVDKDSIACTSEYAIYSYDGIKRAGTGSGWEKLNDFTALQKGLGYIFQASKTGVLTVHVGKEYLDFTAQNESELLHTYESTDVANASWNFLGNPFFSYYDIEDLAKEYDSPIVVWNGRGYDVWKPGDDDYQLKPFEAFFVQKTITESVVNFRPEGRKSYNQIQELKELRANKRTKLGTEINLERLLVNITIMDGDSVTDRTRIVYSTKASMDYEIGVDASKFHADGVPQIYTLNGTAKYAINERPMGGDDIKLGYIAPKAGVYTLSVPRQDADVEIYDNVAQAIVDFTFGDYAFETKAGTFNDRFVIRKTGGVTAVENGFRLDGLTVTTFDGGLDIEGSMKGKVSIYNEAGMLLAEPRQTGKLELGAGVYVVKIGERSVKMSVL